MQLSSCYLRPFVASDYIVTPAPTTNPPVHVLSPTCRPPCQRSEISPWRITSLFYPSLLPAGAYFACPLSTSSFPMLSRSSSVSPSHGTCSLNQTSQVAETYSVLASMGCRCFCIRCIHRFLHLRIRLFASTRKAPVGIVPQIRIVSGFLLAPNEAVNNPPSWCQDKMARNKVIEMGDHPFLFWGFWTCRFCQDRDLWTEPQTEFTGAH